ncbi:MAG: UbiA family prenyltransferase [Solimonas sp.]
MTSLRTTSIPLCVDLDGSLIRSDLLLESLLLLLKRNPLYLLRLPFWLLGGKAQLKAQIAARVSFNAAALPYTAGFLAWLKAQKQAGRALWLVTASNERLAQGVAQHLGLFDGVLASDDATNLSGRHKAQALMQRFGEHGFDYCGNARVDLAVWRHAHAAVVVNGSPRLQAEAGALTAVSSVFPAPPADFKTRLKTVLKAMRVHQWAKNALILVPAAAAHRIADPDTLLKAAQAFLAFSLCASSVYLLNDMLDLEADREHHSKHARPFAAGTLSLLFGFAAVPLLLAAAAVIGALLSPEFLAVLAVYYLGTLLYSLRFKREMMLDVLFLTGLYTLRVVAGAAATAIELSFWLLVFSTFIFLSLAIVKRYAELHAMRVQGKLKASGRGYRVEDLNVLQNLGGASGYISVLVLALYVNSPDIAHQYSHPRLVWLAIPILLYWISRIWMQTTRGQMHDDPLVYAIKDRISLMAGGLMMAILILAT